MRSMRSRRPVAPSRGTWLTTTDAKCSLDHRGDELSKDTEPPEPAQPELRRSRREVGQALSEPAQEAAVREAGDQHRRCVTPCPIAPRRRRPDERARRVAPELALPRTRTKIRAEPFRNVHPPSSVTSGGCRGPAGNRMSSTILATIIQRSAKRAGIQKHVSAHTLRHTAATWLRQQTGDARLVAAYLGHADLSTVSRYAHIATDELHAAADAISEMAGLADPCTTRTLRLTHWAEGVGSR